MTSPVPHAIICASDRPLRILLCDALKPMGFTTLPLADSTEIARYARFRDVHLIVLDYLVADAAAIDVAHGFRNQGVNAPVLIVTSLPDDPAFGREEAFTQVLLKPFTLSELRDEVRALCPALLPDLPPKAPDS